jgi:putative ATP-binding cassette transporter
MRLFQLFSKHAPNRIFFAVFTGGLSGILYAFLIPVIMTALTAEQPHFTTQEESVYSLLGIEISSPAFAATFLGLCITILIARTISQVILSRVAMDVTSRLRKQLYKQISKAPIAALERTGSSKLVQSMTTDVQRIVFGAQVIPDLIIQMITLVGLLGFLYYLSSAVFGYVMVIIIFGIVTFQIPIFIGQRYFTRSRRHLDNLQDGFQGLVEGAKELKLNEKKQNHFIDTVLHQEEHHAISLDKTAFTIVQCARNYGDMICFVAIGAIGFIFTNYHAITIPELAGVIMTLLYITGPVAFILNVIPEIAQSQVSLNKIQALFEELPIEDLSSKIEPVAKWNTLRFSNVEYQYETTEKQSGRNFSVGPIDACIRRGEITFIVGGNGSGKSTFAKVLSLHYQSNSGQIYFGETIISKDNMNSFRQEIACIYSDYYLFERLHNSASQGQEQLALIQSYLEKFDLHNKVSFDNGKFSTIKLSDGQRRRLALLVAFMEEKTLYIFDEWAADQDPYFKEMFYFDILPKLKAQGKAVVAISHDDRYFHVADQLIILENGQIKKQTEGSLKTDIKFNVRQ